MRPNALIRCRAAEWLVYNKQCKKSNEIRASNISLLFFDPIVHVTHMSFCFYFSLHIFDEFSTALFFDVECWHTSSFLASADVFTQNKNCRTKWITLDKETAAAAAISFMFQFMYDTGLSAAQVGWFHLSVPTIIATTTGGTAFICETYKRKSPSRACCIPLKVHVELSFFTRCVAENYSPFNSSEFRHHRTLARKTHLNFPRWMAVRARACMPANIVWFHFSHSVLRSRCARLRAKTRTDVYVPRYVIRIVYIWGIQYAAHAHHRNAPHTHSGAFSILFRSDALSLCHTSKLNDWACTSHHSYMKSIHSLTHRSDFTLRVLGILWGWALLLLLLPTATGLQRCVRFDSKAIVNFPFGSRFSLIVDVQNTRRENRKYSRSAWITAFYFFSLWNLYATIFRTPFSFSTIFFLRNRIQCRNLVCLTRDRKKKTNQTTIQNNKFNHSNFVIDFFYT